MNHQAVEQNNVVERYVQQRLAANERLAFQEHYFACDECFAEVQSMSHFIAGVRDASESGVLNKEPLQESAGSFWTGWLQPVFALSVAASLLLAVAVIWLWFWKVPAFRQELARERQTREESEKSLSATRNQAEQTQRQLELERTENAKLTSELQTQASPDKVQRPPSDLIAQVSVPTVVLESTRDAQGSENQLTIPANAKTAVLTIPIDPESQFDSFQVQILTKTRQPIQTINAAKPKRHGNVKVGVPAKILPSGQYLVRLYGVREGTSQLLGDYNLNVVIKR